MTDDDRALRTALLMGLIGGFAWGALVTVIVVALG